MGTSSGPEHSRMRTFAFVLLAVAGCHAEAEAEAKADPYFYNGVYGGIGHYGGVYGYPYAGVGHHLSMASVRLKLTPGTQPTGSEFITECMATMAMSPPTMVME